MIPCSRAFAIALLVSAITLELSINLSAQHLGSEGTLRRAVGERTQSDGASLLSAQKSLLFVQNVGQWQPDQLFSGNIGGTLVAFDRKGVSYAYMVDSLNATRKGASRRGEQYLLRTTFVGSNPAVRVDGASENQARFNYYLGSDERDWHVDAKSFEKIRYRGLYKGIDAVYYGRGSGMKYDFIVSPGADPRGIQLRYEGTSGLSVNRAGELVVRTPFGSVREAPPYCYQEINGRRREVSGRYRLDGGNVYGFEMDAWDHRYPLVIDPCLSVEYATYLGGGGYDVVTSLAADSAGNAYAVGFTRAPDFPQVPTQGQLDGRNYIFVSKISADGTKLLYSTIIGRPYDAPYYEVIVDGRVSHQAYESIGADIEVRPTGEAFVAMTTLLDSLTTTSGALKRKITPNNPSSACGPAVAQNADAYIARLDATGKIVWGTYLGGVDNDYVVDMALNAQGQPCITGTTYAPTCGAGTGDTLSYPTTSANFTSADRLRGFETFVTVLNSDGRSINYSVLYGGTGNEFVGHIDVDATGRLYLLGSTNSDNLPTTAGAYQTARAVGGTPGVYDLFVARIIPQSGTLDYSSYICDNGGAGRRGLGIGGYTVTPKTLLGFERQELRQDLLIGPGGNSVVIGGSTRSTGLPVTSGAFQPSLNNAAGAGDTPWDIFVIRLDIGSSSRITGATYFGGSKFDALGGLAFDRFGDIGAAITTKSTDLPISPINVQPTLQGVVDAAIITFSPDLSKRTYGTFLGGSGTRNQYLYEHSVYGLTADTSGALYLFGGTASPDLRVTPGVIGKSSDYYGGYIIKFSAPSAAKIGIGLEVAFETNACGDAVVKPLLLFNSGQSPMQVDSLKFKGTNGVYTIVGAPAVPFVLASCDTLTLNVQFNADKLECKSLGEDALVVVAPGALTPRVEVPVSGRRTCLTFNFNEGTTIRREYKLNGETPAGIPVYVNGGLPQYVTIVPDSTNKGYFTPAFSDSSVIPVGSQFLQFKVDVPDTGTFCEKFTAYVEPCKRKFSLTLCLHVRSGIFQSDTVIDLGLITCRDLLNPLIVHNGGNDELKTRVGYIDGPAQGDIVFDPAPDQSRTIAIGESVVYPMYIRPKSFGRREATVVFYTDEGSVFVGTIRSIKIRYEIDSVAFRLSTAGTGVLVGGFGDLVDLPVTYEPILEGRLPVEEFSLYAKFDPKMLDLVGIGTSGTKTDGWTMVRNQHVDSGAFVVIRTNALGTGVFGGGPLVRLRFKVLRGDTTVSPFAVRLAGVSTLCFYSEADSGRLFQLSAECATGDRLLYQNRRLMKPIVPNPVNEKVTIGYTIPEDQEATLILYDINGREVMRPIARRLPIGDATIEIDTRTLAPGLYYCRLTVGPWLTETRTMVIAR